MQGLRPLQRYFDFSGRSGRAEYWQFLALFVLAATISYLIDLGSDVTNTVGIPVLFLMVVLVAQIPAYAVTTRRLHDRGKSGWLIVWMSGFNLFGFICNAIADRTYNLVLLNLFRVTAIAALVGGSIISIYALVQLCQRGDSGQNVYGPPDDGATDRRGSVANNTLSAMFSPKPATLHPTDEMFTSIERLGKLREQGLITEDEFAAQKARLLNTGS